MSFVESLSAEPPPRPVSIYPDSQPVQRPVSRRATVPKTAQTKSPVFKLQPWMVIVALVVVAGIIALIVAMSGPDVAAGK